MFDWALWIIGMMFTWGMLWKADDGDSIFYFIMKCIGACFAWPLMLAITIMVKEKE